ncbi:MAG: type III-B CRISPR-associated protein Cas10/Cmr2, partial [Candidatus Bathyarchaeota archaeon]|nr:type III-B CRISPR-associated protein Cas10/Cmr2 [Candidatus Bathyarchaeota archaeon]
IASLPLRLTHVLSDDSREREIIDKKRLASIIKEVEKGLEAIGKSVNQSTAETYLKIYNYLKRSSLHCVPADANAPMNDVSLWQHLKLTAAFANCIWWDEGYRGDELENYSFALLSGDADKVSKYVRESTRLPDLSARSRRIDKATDTAALSIEKNLGPECLIFFGGGSILALCPHSEEILQKVIVASEREFEKATQNQVRITVNPKKVDGATMQKSFGKVWETTVREMRLKKLDPPISARPTVEKEAVVCDVCRVRKATKEDRRKVLPLNPPRPEGLCDICGQLRDEGKGVWLDNIKKDTDFVGVIKADGDDMGKALCGDIFESIGKTVTPSRLSELSSLVHRTFEWDFKEIVRRHEGTEVFVGGDDLLAVFPGEKALCAARELASEFANKMAGVCTMSAGVAILNYKLPMYVGLEKADTLIRIAKEAGKDSAAFAVIGSTGITKSEMKKRAKPYRWSELSVLLDLLDSLRGSEVASVQKRKIAELSQRSLELAEAYVKHLMGREVISWGEGEEYLSHLHSGVFSDAFLLFNAFKSRKKEEKEVA